MSSILERRSLFALFDWLRERWKHGIPCQSDAAFAFGASLVWLALYNVRFWQETLHWMWHGDLSSAVFLSSLAVVVVCAQALLLLLLPSRRLMRAAASVLFIVAACGAYFALKYGVVMNKDMLRNVMQTDASEARSLITAEFIEWILVLGVAPALLLWKVRMPSSPWRRRLRDRGKAIAIALLACAGALLSSSASYAVFFREHKPIRFMLSPSAPVTSAISLAVKQGRGPPGPIQHLSGPAHRDAPPNARPLLVVLILGETARAANFQLGGYDRATNPRLSTTSGVVYFSKTTSCGTATALSVPCMFSHVDRDHFDVDVAPRYANVLDSLDEAGLHVEWRDNNAGCKGVCARVQTIAYGRSTDPELCSGAYCYDEILLRSLGTTLDELQRDSVIVMHQIGSHGPAYSERYPPAFEAFKPACRSNELQRCSRDEIVNAYDNTILYTDYVVSQTIERLRAASDRIDSVLLYVSDHGESLGEQGLYLHGMPYRFAPDVQTHVPMLLWLSDGYAVRRHIDSACLAATSSAALSHDNVYHTLLGASEVRNASYDPRRDLLARCTTSAPSVGEE